MAMAPTIPRGPAFRLLMNARTWAAPHVRIAQQQNHSVLPRSFSSTTVARDSQGNQLRRRYQAQLDKQMRSRPSMSKGGSEVADMAREQMTGNLNVGKSSNRRISADAPILMLLGESGTYVTPPFTRFPFSLGFTWTLTKRRFLDAVSVFLFRWGSKLGFFKPSVWKVKRSVIITQAKAPTPHHGRGAGRGRQDDAASGVCP